MSGGNRLSVIVPLYKSEPNLPHLFSELARISGGSPFPMEVVFVNDGSPDDCDRIVREALPELPFGASLISLSRNFGAFAAIAAGLQYARGDYFAVIAADLQEPPELLVQFAEKLATGNCDVVFGKRATRADPLLTRLSSNLFWTFYRRLVNPQIPEGGVDVFGCTRQVRDEICALKEVETSLVALLFWIGFRRGFVSYDRRVRLHGKSAWTFSKKLQYLINSVFNFTDLPIKLLFVTGVGGLVLSAVAGLVIVVAKLTGRINVPGYAAIALLLLFFGGMTTLGIGIVGQYTWLTLQNARNRPSFIVRKTHTSDPTGHEANR